MWLCMTSQEMARLDKLLKSIKSKELRDFCAALLSNQIGGVGSSLRISAGLSAQKQTLLELLVHLDSVLLTGNLPLVPLKQIAFQPQNVTVSLKGTVLHLYKSCFMCSSKLLKFGNII